MFLARALPQMPIFVCHFLWRPLIKVKGLTLKQTSVRAWLPWFTEGLRHKAGWKKGLVTLQVRGSRSSEDLAIICKLGNKESLHTEAASGWTRRRRSPWVGKGKGQRRSGLGSNSKGVRKWNAQPVGRMACCLGFPERRSNKASIKEARFAAWTFSGSSKTTFCWVKQKWMRIRWTTFLSNTHGRKKRRGERTWQNASQLLPNPKYLKNHTGRISNPNICLDSPTPNCSCGRLMKWIVHKKMGSEWRSLIKENDWGGLLAGLPLRT